MPKISGEADYESTPVARSEYITALVHLYRGELYRSNSWRLRLDHTTNWAVISTAGLLTFSFGDVNHSHWTLLLGLLLVTVFLGFEARRFRFAHMWRSRLRLIEENFYGPILRRDPVSPERDWGALVAEDLFHPSFKIGRMQALRMRLVRNYWAIYAALLLSWCLKILVHPTTASDWGTIVERLSLGVLPWWSPLVFVVGFCATVASVVALAPRMPSNELDYWVGLPDSKPIIDL